MTSHGDPYSKPRRKISEGGSHGETGENRRIPRPMNCFMIFRKEFVARRMQATSRTTKGKSLASQAGEAWRSLSASEQEPYKRRADELSAEHARLYPNYKFVIRRSRKPQETSQPGHRTRASKSSSARQQEPVVHRERPTLPTNSLRQEAMPSYYTHELGPPHPPVLQYPHNSLLASNFAESIGRLSRTWPDSLNQASSTERPNPEGVSLLPLPSFQDTPLSSYPLGAAHEPSLGSPGIQYPGVLYSPVALAEAQIASSLNGMIFHTAPTADTPPYMTPCSQGVAAPPGALRNSEKIGPYHFKTAGSPIRDLFLGEPGPSAPSTILYGRDPEQHTRLERLSALQMDDFDPFSPRLLYSQFSYPQQHLGEANVANGGPPIRGDLREHQDVIPGLNVAHPLQEYVIDEFLRIPRIEENAVASVPSH